MDESASGPSEAFKPPYMAFQTFWTFTEDLASRPLPPVIDRSLMNSKSGTDQANLLSALRTFGLIDEENKVQPALIALADDDPEARKGALAELVRRFYSSALKVSGQNGTQHQLTECFRQDYGISGADTLRKSLTFFLHAARASDIPLSPHFPATRSGQGAPGKSKPRKSRKTRASTEDGGKGNNAGQVENSDQYQLAVQLRNGGTMTLSVSVNALSLRGEDRVFFYDIVDKLTDYQEKSTSDGPRPSEQEKSE